MGKRGRGPARAKARSSSSGVTLVAQGKGLVKRTQQNPFDPAGSDETDYAVRVIKAERVKGDAAQWLVGWEGFSDKEDTWEPIEHLAGYEAEIREFRERKKVEASKARELRARRQLVKGKGSRKRSYEVKVLIDVFLCCGGFSFFLDDGFGDAQGGKRRSAVWKHFRIQKNETGKVANVRCCLCPPESKSIPYSGNTTNLRVHLTSCHKDEYCKLLEGNGSDAGTTETEGSSQHTLDALVPQVSAEKRDELHKLITKWLVRCGRPLTLPEHDQEFREVFYCLTKGQYVPPTYHTVVENVLKLSVEGKERLVRSLKDLKEEGILPSMCGDIWSQGGISIFGILVYWLDEYFEVHECLLAAIPFSNVRHTGVELEKATKVAVQMYDVESPLKANNAAPNPDGSVYRHHQLMLHEWDIVRESMYLLRYAKEAVDLLQSTKTVTGEPFSTCRWPIGLHFPPDHSPQVRE
ncbi:hypothetical protein CYMTET_43707 [Cymbomonas tetramitiformis]|uniref:Chromo domain-containing protein n=1 Tax=Cymbomonas tetramitiformis TaxID=36881 RepID=A0AAE0C2X5_9CHLO|nr:hypothetical protein CYMTET_43707 [Cymbomonas tetramitiformis]